MSKPRPAVDPDLADEVASFLRTHPFFLAENPDLYRVLLPPARVHGEPFADHMAAMIRITRARAAELAAQADGVVAAGRAAAGLSERVQEAVLSLIAADNPAEWVDSVLPSMLGLDAAAICLESFLPGTRRLPAGTVARLLGGRAAVFRDRPGDANLVHAEAAPLARRDALLRIPGAEAMLALACRDPAALTADQAAPLGFLARAVGAALRLA